MIRAIAILTATGREVGFTVGQDGVTGITIFDTSIRIDYKSHSKVFVRSNLLSYDVYYEA